jgi:uridine kinase
MNCAKEIANLENELLNLKESDQKLIDDLKRQLAERKEQYEKLLEQWTSSLNYQKKLETENTLLWIGVGTTVTIAVVTTIWALIERSRE